MPPAANATCCPQRRRQPSFKQRGIPCHCGPAPSLRPICDDASVASQLSAVPVLSPRARAKPRLGHHHPPCARGADTLTVCCPWSLRVAAHFCCCCSALLLQVLQRLAPATRIQVFAALIGLGGALLGPSHEAAPLAVGRAWAVYLLSETRASLPSPAAGPFVMPRGGRWPLADVHATEPPFAARLAFTRGAWSACVGGATPHTGYDIGSISGILVMDEFKDTFK